jgi:hypothetical protein
MDWRIHNGRHRYNRNYWLGSPTRNNWYNDYCSVLFEVEREKFVEIAPFLLAEPDIEKGEELVTITDEVPKPKNYRIKHQNRMHFGKKMDYEWICEECDETVPPNKYHVCKPKRERRRCYYDVR